jgi:hypothetical protein
MRKIQRTLIKFSFLGVLVLVSGCLAQLAPQYDRALFDGITRTNQNLMQFFASVAEGAAPAEFPTREASYNRLIGAVESLALQSRARPMPKNDSIDKVNRYLDERGIAPVDNSEAPSADALDQIATQLTKMKSVDRENGLRPGAVALFKNAVVISMDQAMTYESFLDR